MDVGENELLEILNYYSYYFDSASEQIKKDDLLRVTKECLKLREQFQEILDVDLTRIRRE